MKTKSPRKINDIDGCDVTIVENKNQEHDADTRHIREKKKKKKREPQQQGKEQTLNFSVFWFFDSAAWFV